MAKLKVSIVNSSTLRLDERGEIGDIIDLHDLQSVDNAPILDAIEKAKDQVYQQKLKQEIERQVMIKSAALSELDKKHKDEYFALTKEKQDIENRLSSLTKSLEEQKRIAVLEVEKKKELELQQAISAKEKLILELESQIKTNLDKQKLLLDNEKQAIQSHFKDVMNAKEQELLRLQSQIERLKAEERETLLKKENEVQSFKSLLNEKENQHNLELTRQSYELKEKFNEQLTLKETEINQLKLSKSNLQVKMLGEELERWCNSEYEAFALSGFEDCKWYKDNKAIKDNPDEKGTKADYIFEVYANKDKDEKQRLLTVVCEMKNEAPDTKTKTKNSDHYKKLNDDRLKKNAQYALLISELEWDTVNDAPIKKIADYENMYMVRPTYFMAFLSLIRSLANKYQDLLLEHHHANENFLESQEIIAEFEQFKNTYLDKPLESLLKDVEKIKTEANKAYESSYKIMGLADTIITNKIAEIKQKIERFDIKKIARKVQKLEQKD